MDITGTVIRIGDEVQVSDKFRKRTFVIKDSSSQYPQTLEFQCSQDRCELLDNVHTGAVVKVYFNLRGKEWVNNSGDIKVFNTLDVWKVDVQGKENYESSMGNTGTSHTSPDDLSSVSAYNKNQPEDLDLPF